MTVLKINSKHLNIKAFYEILKLIFENNYFKYNKKIYRQAKGIAMGTKCGPSIANVYLYILEIQFLKIHRPLFYSRFVDDIFIIVSSGFDISILQKHFGYLKLNISSSNSLEKNYLTDSENNTTIVPKVNFLDLDINLNKFTNKLNFSVYIN